MEDTNIYNKKEIIDILGSDRCKKIYKALGVNSVLLFGSIVNGDFEEYSDVDIAILCNKKIKLIEIMDLEEELSHIINRDVDIVYLNDPDLDLRFKVTVYDNSIVIYNDDLDLYSKYYDKTDIIYRNNEAFRFFRERDVMENE